MSTDVREEIENAGGADDMPEPGFRPEPVADEEGEQVVPWYGEVDEETQKTLAARGWDKDPQGLIKSQREAESQLRKEQQARAEMERELAEAREAMQAGQQAQQGPPSDDPFGLVALADRYENGEISFRDYTAQATGIQMQLAYQMASEMAAQQVAPLQRESVDRSLNETARELASIYPDFRDLSDDVMGMIERDPTRYGTPEGMRAAYGLVRSQRDADQARERNAARQVETLDSGSRNSSPQDLAKAAREAIRNAGGGPNRF